MGNTVSEADSYTEEYSAYESSRLRNDDNDTWDYSMEESRGRIAPSESSTSGSDERGNHRKVKSPVNYRSRSPPRSPAPRSPVRSNSNKIQNKVSLQSFSDEDDPTTATFMTDMARRDKKATQQQRISRSNSPRRASSPRSPQYAGPTTTSPPRSPYASPRSSPRNHRERRQPQYDSDEDSSILEERDRRQLYRYGRDRSGDDRDRDGCVDHYESKDESDDERYQKQNSPRRDRKSNSKLGDSKVEDEEEEELDDDDDDDVDYESITDVSVELNPNRRLEALRRQESADNTIATREVDVIQLHESLDEDRRSHDRRSPRQLPSPIHLEHLPSPPNSPLQQQVNNQTTQSVYPNSPGQAFVYSPTAMSPLGGDINNASREASPQLFFRNDVLLKHAQQQVLIQQASPVAGNPPMNELYTAVPLNQSEPFLAKLLNDQNDGTLSPIPSVTAETYYGGSFHAIIDQAELYPELSASYAEMSRQTFPSEVQYQNDDDDNDSSEPRGDHACDETVEHSLMTSPEESMARQIIQARLRRALAHGLSFNESMEESMSAPSVSVKSRNTVDNNQESTESFDDGDIEFVQQYEAVFDQFVNANLNLMARHPELIYNLRVAKLQKMFQIAADTEADVDEQIQAVEADKRQLLINHKKELIEAARRKAALEIQLRQELNSIEQATLEVTGKMTWQLIVANLTRANRHHQLIQNLTRNRVSRSTLLEILPATPETQGIRSALTAPPGRRLTDRQQQQMRQLQVDNTFLKAEINVLEKKLAAQQATAKKYAWVDSIFVRMEPKHIKKLKHRFQKNLGVSF